MHCPPVHPGADPQNWKNGEKETVARKLKPCNIRASNNPGPNGFELASTIHYITILNIQICIVADEVRWIRIQGPVVQNPIELL